MMKLLTVLSFSLGIALLAIGIHQTLFFSLEQTYFLFAFSFAFILTANYFRTKADWSKPNKEKKVGEKTNFKTKNQPQIPRASRRLDKKKNSKNL